MNAVSTRQRKAAHKAWVTRRRDVGRRRIAEFIEFVENNQLEDCRVDLLKARRAIGRALSSAAK